MTGAPTRQRRAHPTPGTVQHGNPDHERSDRLVTEELMGVAEMIHAALLTAKAGHRSVVHVRRAAVRLVALDAALAEASR